MISISMHTYVYLEPVYGAYMVASLGYPHLGSDCSTGPCYSVSLLRSGGGSSARAKGLGWHLA